MIEHFDLWTASAAGTVDDLLIEFCNLWNLFASHGLEHQIKDLEGIYLGFNGYCGKGRGVFSAFRYSVKSGYRNIVRYALTPCHQLIADGDGHIVVRADYRFRISMCSVEEKVDCFLTSVEPVIAFVDIVGLYLKTCLCHCLLVAFESFRRIL